MKWILSNWIQISLVLASLGFLILLSIAVVEVLYSLGRTLRGFFAKRSGLRAEKLRLKQEKIRAKTERLKIEEAAKADLLRAKLEEKNRRKKEKILLKARRRAEKERRRTVKKRELAAKLQKIGAPTMIMLGVAFGIIGILSLISMALFFVDKGFAITFLTLSTVIFILHSLRRIRTVHKGIWKIFGERQVTLWGITLTLNEGWKIFPFFPFLFSFEEIEVERVDFDLEPMSVRTPDMAEIEIHSSETFTPDPEHLINYENSGKAEGVMNILEDLSGAAMREMAVQPNQKPETWKEAVQMPKDFLKRVVEKIRGKFPENFQNQEIDDLVEDLGNGNGILRIIPLGIILNRISIKKIHPKGKLMEAAEKVAIEAQEREADMIELQNVRDRIEEFKSTGLNPQEAARVIQVERKKVTHDVKENRISISPEIMEPLAPLVSALASSVQSKSSGIDTGPIGVGLENGLKAIATAIENRDKGESHGNKN